MIDDAAADATPVASLQDSKNLEEILVTSPAAEGGEAVSIANLLSFVSLEVASGAARLLTATAGASYRFGRSMLRPERLEMMRDAGLYLRDAREVAGLTLMEMSEALDLEDKTLLQAVESGTATISFEFILRIAALVARHDPVPFVMRLTRTYNPAVWRILHDWGVGRLTLQVEREREFVNILRRHDAARKLSDEGYKKVLAFTREAFEMALHYAAHEEGLVDHVVDPEATGNKVDG